MRLCRSVRPLALAVLLAAVPVLAMAGTNTWTSNGPAGQRVRALAQSPTALYAGSDNGGIFHSTDGGASWSGINTGLTGTVVRALAVDPLTPSTLYAGLSDAGAFRSVDAGATWGAINTGLTTASVLALAVDPQTPATLYAGTSGGGVFKSVNGGVTWTAINTGSTATIVQALAIDPTNSDVVYLGGQSAGVFKSVDGGLTWSNIAVVPNNVSTIAIDPVTPDTVYCGSVVDGVFKSTTGGGGWTQMSTRLVAALAIDPDTPSTVYAGTWFTGVEISLNAGATWLKLNDGLGNLNVFAFLVDQATPTHLYAGTLGAGVFEYESNACEVGGMPVTCAPCETCVPAFGCVGDVWPSCRVSTKLRAAKLTIKDKDPDLRDRMVWTWSRGDDTPVEAFGDPVTTHTYEACLFDESAGPPALAMRIEVQPNLICNNKPCWQPVADRAFKYRNNDGVPNGATKLILKSGVAGKAKIIMKAHGELIEMPTLPLALPFRFQLRNDLGECWEAVYVEDGTRKNDESSYVGKDGL